MLAGLNGFMEGFRWGREVVGDDPESRKLRTAEAAARQEAAANLAKQDLDRYKFEKTQGSLDAYRGLKLAGEEESRQLQADRNKQAEQHWTELAPTRELTRQELENKVKTQQANAAYQRGTQQDMELLNRIYDNSASPEDAERFKQTFGGWATQDAEQSVQQLKGLMSQAGALVQQGRKADADAMMSTPEAAQIFSRAYGPLFAQNVGKPADADGKYVITDNRPVGVIRSPDGGKLGFMLEVRKEPSEAFRQQVLSSDLPDDEKQAALQPLVDRVPLTEGRVPVGQGGQTRWFTPEDFQKGMGLMEYLAEAQRKHPDQFEELRAMQMGKMAGDTPAKGMKEALLALDRHNRRKDRASGAGSTKALIDQWQHVIGRMMPSAFAAEENPALKEQLAKKQMLGADIIRKANGNITLEEVNRLVEERVPTPKTDEEIDGAVASLVNKPPPAATAHPIKSDPVAAGIRSNSKLTREQKVKMLLDLGYTNEDF